MSQTNGTLLEIESVSKIYQLGKTSIKALHEVSFNVRTGEFLSIVGPSGCGKTTMLNIIGCIDKPTSGTVRFAGTDVTQLSDAEEADIRLARMGFVFQSFNLVPVLTVEENVEFPLILKGVPKRKRRERVRELVEAVGLSDYYGHKPDELSGGQRQRVAIARALVNEPQVVIADEPTANLDSKTGEMILQLMKQLNEEKQVSFIFSTHDPDVMQHAKRIVHLRDGEIEEIEERTGEAPA